MPGLVRPDGGVVDEDLRVRARGALGPLGDALAQDALEHGAVVVERDVRAWEGSHGTVHGHRIVVLLPEDLRARVVARHAAMDGLCAALAAAMAERGTHDHAVSDVRVEAGPTVALTSGPYRGRPPGR